MDVRRLYKLGFKPVHWLHVVVGVGIALAATWLLSGGGVFAQTEEANSNPYSINRYDSQDKQVLFLLSTSGSDAEAADWSERNLDIFRQVVSSYWSVDADVETFNDYNQGQLDEYDLIVISDEVGSPLPSALEGDIFQAEGKQIVWFGFNGDIVLERLTGTETASFPEPLTVDSVTYKDTALPTGEGTDLSILYGVDERVGSGNPAVHGWTDTEPREPLSYHIDDPEAAGNSSFTVFPFVLPSYYSTQSYTNAMLDILHLSFGNIEDIPQRALLRLEDVSGYAYRYPRNNLFKTYDLLRDKNAPYHLALIGRYVHPEDGTDSLTAEHRHFLHRTKEAIANQMAVPIHHGYTHQYKDGISAFDYEFWDEENDSPVEEDSEEYVNQRVAGARESTNEAGFPDIDIWETPHYALSSLDNEVINRHYPLRYERIPGIGSFPFTVNIDNTIYIPENLGYIEQDWEEEFNALQQRYDRLTVFRNATPSLFWHPWRDVHEIDELTSFITENGFEFVHAYDLLEVERESAAAGAVYAQIPGSYTSNTGYHFLNYIIYGVYLLLILGIVIYIRNQYYFWKHWHRNNTFSLNLEQLRHLAHVRGARLPVFTIFVPARNEGFVIANTIHSLVDLDYPESRYQIVIITDERERKDDVETLTQDEVERCKKRYNTEYETELIVHLEVPDWYGGGYGDSTDDYGKSTKGRALNYALGAYNTPKRWRDYRQFVGVVDADGRLNSGTLIEAAAHIITKGSRLLQGPVYQVSNLSNVSMIGVLASLELAYHHLTEMMRRMSKGHRFQFLAGTNYFIDRRLLQSLGGWDKDSLVEDAELALRAFSRNGITAQSLTVAELEQTPPNFSVYRRQRERWARGHLQLLSDIRRARIPLRDKLSFYRKVWVSQMRFILDLGVPILLWTLLINGLLRDADPIFHLMFGIIIIASIFIWDTYGQAYRRLVRYSDKKSDIYDKFNMSVILFISLPVLIVIQAIPRMQALVNYIRKTQISWYKTERTREQAQ